MLTKKRLRIAQQAISHITVLNGYKGNKIRLVSVGAYYRYSFSEVENEYSRWFPGYTARDGKWVTYKSKDFYRLLLLATTFKEISALV